KADKFMPENATIDLLDVDEYKEINRDLFVQRDITPDPNVAIIQVGQYIPILVTAEDVSQHKPFPDTFLECARRMGIEPQHCLVFEDAVNGFKAAEAAGMEWIDVTKYHTPEYIF
ncbi:MAG: HAD-IA family hydrolase, partial [Cytophagales bacterium]|nr:HAD-IA family hydrolase [Cytophaga sp.]